MAILFMNFAFRKSSAALKLLQIHNPVSEFPDNRRRFSDAPPACRITRKNKKYIFLLTTTLTTSANQNSPLLARLLYLCFILFVVSGSFRPLLSLDLKSHELPPACSLFARFSDFPLCAAGARRGFVLFLHSQSYTLPQL